MTNDTLSRLAWIDLPEDIERNIGPFQLNPSIPLPIEPEEGKDLSLEDVTWGARHCRRPSCVGQQPRS